MESPEVDKPRIIIGFATLCLYRCESASIAKYLG